MNEINYFDEHIFDDIIELHGKQLSKYRKPSTKDAIDDMCIQFSETVFIAWKTYHKQLMASDKTTETIKSIYNKFKESLHVDIIEHMEYWENKT